MTTPPTPYPDLNGVLHEMVASVQAILGANFIGAYLQGSFAVGDFDEHSDVDWTIVTAEEMSAAQVAALQELHPRLYAL
jgi:predicted nucleotidyltransferase